MDKDFITLEETKDQLIGEVGTQKRDDYEEELRLYAIGAAIRQTRKLQNLTDFCNGAQTFQSHEHQCKIRH